MQSKQIFFFSILLLTIVGFGCNRSNIYLNSSSSFSDPSASSNQLIGTSTFHHPPNSITSSELVERIEELNREIAKNPEAIELYMDRGLAYKKLIFNQMLSSRMEDYRYVGEWSKQARQDFDVVIAHDPKNARAYAEKVQVGSDCTIATDDTTGNIKTYTDQCEKDIEEISKAIELDPTNGDYYMDRGLRYFDLKQQPQALHDFNLALQFTTSTKRQTDIKFYRAQLYVSSGEYQKAQKDYEDVLAVMPQYQPALGGYSALRGKLKE